jgi:predicted DNA-binding transcriptional regulator YafY
MVKEVKILYTNWKGVTKTRLIIPKEIFYGSNEWHKKEQWLMRAHDVEKDAERTFAMKDIKEWNSLNL